MRACILVTIGLLGCGPKPAPVAPGDGSGSTATHPGEVPAVAGPEGAVLVEDTPLTTQVGASYFGPRAWSKIASGAIQILTTPDGGAAVAIVDATATDPDAAVAEAWQLYRSTPAPALDHAVDAAPRDGWDQLRQYWYTAAPDDPRSANALAFRHGTRWTIVVFDGAIASLTQHGSAVKQISASLRPPP